MKAKTVAVMVGDQTVFQSVPGATLLVPGLKSERDDVIATLRSVLALLGCDLGRAPRDAVERNIAHEANDVSAPVIAMPVCAKENGGAAKLPRPICDGVVALELIVDGAVLDHHHAEGDALLANASKLNCTH